MAHIINAPLGLPTGVPLRLLHDPRMIADVEAFIRCFAPESSVVGRVDAATSFHLAPGEALLICSPDWAQLAERFDVEIGPSRVFVLLEPENYVWGHADFARSLPSWPQRVGSERVSVLEGRAHFSKWAKLVVNDDGSLGRVDPDTLWFFQDRASRNAAALAEVKRHLADAESLLTLETLLTGSVADLFRRYSERVFRHVQYMECGAFFPGMVIVDGGIQEGFELPYYMAHTAGTAHIVCVDPSGFSRLGPFVAATVEHFAKQFTVVPRALWSSTGDVSLPVQDGIVLGQFKDKNYSVVRQQNVTVVDLIKPGALWSSTGDVTLSVQDGIIVLGQFKDKNSSGFPEVMMPCDTIDNIVRQQNLAVVDLIKLDVEGAEPEVLRGMRETVAEHRPQLAISVYHWPEHMWDLSLELMRSLPDYDFYLRHYSFGRWECILYAVPKPGTAPRLDRHRRAG